MSILMPSILTVVFCLQRGVICDSIERLVGLEGGGHTDEQVARMKWGIPTSYKEHPYVGHVTQLNETSGQYGYECTGSLITPQIFLTSAHCVRRDRHLIAIRYGTSTGEATDGQSNELGRGIDCKVNGIYSHPEYRDSGDNMEIDYALLRLEKPIEHTRFVLQLPEPDEEDVQMSKEHDVTVVSMGASNLADPKYFMHEGHINELWHCTFGGIGLRSMIEPRSLTSTSPADKSNHAQGPGPGGARSTSHHIRSIAGEACTLCPPSVESNMLDLGPPYFVCYNNTTFKNMPGASRPSGMGVCLSPTHSVSPLAFQVTRAHQSSPTLREGKSS